MNEEILGIDMGGTNLRAGLMKENILSMITSQRVHSKGSANDVMHQLFHLVDKTITPQTKAIGIGVPGLVSEGIVYDVINISSWKEIRLQKILKERYHLPVFVNNDANCFALGELYFGKGVGHASLIGLTIGTGLGSGIIINKRLLNGDHGGAGEFGMIGYLDQCYEYYASGQFFQNEYGINGETVFNKAAEGDESAIKMYEQMGMHLGNAIKTILYATDVSLIILGGSVSKAFPYFSKTMWEQIQTFAYKKAMEQLKIEVSDLDHSGIRGAAALCF